MEEKWKDIIGYEGLYQVSNIGRVKRLDTYLPDKRGRYYHRKGCILKQQIVRSIKSKTNRLSVSLYKDNHMKLMLVHRLVATAFIANPHGKPEVNHIDGNGENNTVSNLEWVTHDENVIHSIYKLENPPHFSMRRVKCIETGVVYPSVCSAARDTGILQSSISAVAIKRRGLTKTHGMHWEFV